jgi:hypothetical protein
MVLRLECQCACRIGTPANATPAAIASRASRAIKRLADAWLRGDSAAKDFRKSEERPMDFNMSDRQKEWLGRVESFMTKHVRPAVPVYKAQDAEASAGR